MIRWKNGWKAVVMLGSVIWTSLIPKGKLRFFRRVLSWLSTAASNVSISISTTYSVGGGAVNNIIWNEMTLTWLKRLSTTTQTNSSFMNVKEEYFERPESCISHELEIFLCHFSSFWYIKWTHKTEAQLSIKHSFLAI